MLVFLLNHTVPKTKLKKNKNQFAEWFVKAERLTEKHNKEDNLHIHMELKLPNISWRLLRSGLT